jgi:hypothetical protein
MYPISYLFGVLLLHVSAHMPYSGSLCVRSKLLANLRLSWVKSARWMELDYFLLIRCVAIAAYSVDFSSYECQYSKSFPLAHMKICLMCAYSIRDGKRLIYQIR